MLNVGCVLMDPEFLQQVFIERAIENDGEIQNMVFVRSEPTTLSIMASVQEASPADIRKLPEGERSTEALNVFSVSEIRGTSGNSVADRIIGLRGKNWKVQYVAPWAENGYYRALITASENE